MGHPNADPKLSSLRRRMSCCGQAAAFGQDVHLVRNTRTGHARFTGLMHCGSVWACPSCSRRISAVRSAEANDALAAARAEGLSVVLLTTTFRHGRGDDLADILSRAKRAKQRFRQRRGWRALPFVGSITATEVTYSPANGWHPHFHEILFLKASPDDALRLIEALRADWLASLKSQGLTGGKAAFHVQDATAAGAYCTKFGAAEELTVGTAKQGRKGSRTPWQLLSDATEGDHGASALWLHFVTVFHGRRQLVWSPGLKARFGVGEVSDDEAAGEEAEPAAEIVLRTWRGGSEELRLAMRRSCGLLDAAEAGTCLDAAERGPTDRERWQQMLADVSVIE